MNPFHHIAKILGIAVGFVVGRWLGAILGFFIGFMIDKFQREGLLFGRGYKKGEDMGDETDFILSSLILAAAVVKSDNEVSDLELSYVHTFLADQFGLDDTEKYLEVLQKSVEQEFDLVKIAKEIRQNTSYETRLQILYFLFGIANADYTISSEELATLRLINLHLGLPIEDFESIQAMHLNELDSYYKVLEIHPTASDKEVRDAFQQMSLKYHPDKVANYGEQVQEAAREKFIKVQTAYDKIRKGRGMK